MKLRTIVVEALSGRQGGGQTYLINLFKYLPERLADTLRVIAVIPRDGELLKVNDRIEYIQSSFASSGLIQRMLWSKVKLPAILREVGADVLYCPGGFVSAFGSEWLTAVAFRNMLPFNQEERQRYPPGYMRTRLAALRHVQARSFRKANLVIFLSAYARSVIDIVVGARRGTSVVIPHGVSEDVPAPDAGALPVLPSSYVAYVSILDVYKAQLEVVEAWALMKASRHGAEKLLLVGPDDTPYASRVRALIARLGLQDEVIITSNIAHELLPLVYARATANIFASSCENCPNVLLEALAAGRVVICSDYQPMPEFAGDAALYFDPYSPSSLAKRLCEVLGDPALAAELGRKGRARAAEYQWKRSAASTWQALSDLSARRLEH